MRRPVHICPLLASHFAMSAQPQKMHIFYMLLVDQGHWSEKDLCKGCNILMNGWEWYFPDCFYKSPSTLIKASGIITCFRKEVKMLI